MRGQGRSAVAATVAFGVTRAAVALAPLVTATSGAAVVTLVTLVDARPAAAQVGRRVEAVERGTVRFAYGLKPGVEICERQIRTDARRWSGRPDGSRNCRSDVAEVELDVRGGIVRDVEVVRPLDERPAADVDLGEVPAREAADFLVGLAYAGATPSGAEEAIFPATLADVDDLWRELIDVARARELHAGVRESALFWLGQEAADAATEELSDVALDADEDQEIRDSAIFALSQRPESQAIPALMEVARSAEEAQSRRTAMFWLAQSDDEGVVEFFEEVLLGRIR